MLAKDPGNTKLATQILMVMLARHAHLEVDVMEVREIEILMSEVCGVTPSELLLAWADRGDAASNRIPTLAFRSFKGMDQHSAIQLSILVTHSPQLNCLFFFVLPVVLRLMLCSVPCCRPTDETWSECASVLRGDVLV